MSIPVNTANSEPSAFVPSSSSHALLSIYYGSTLCRMSEEIQACLLGPHLWSVCFTLYLAQGAHHPFRSGQRAPQKGTAEVAQARRSRTELGGVRGRRKWMEEWGSGPRK